MKIRSVVIGVLVGGVLVSGVGYAAYYTMRGQAVPVEVAPVSNMSTDTAWLSFEDSMSGTVTSQATQSISLDSEHSIDEVYVKPGETVDEGTPLFSYDMTLEEIELEGNEIELLSLQLQLSRTQKELARYQNMTPTATAMLQLPTFALTASAQEGEISVESVEPVEAADVPDAGSSQDTGSVQDAGGSQDADSSQNAQDGQGAEVSVESVEPVSPAESTADAADTGSAEVTVDSGDVVVEEIESVPETTDTEEEVYRTAVGQYEDLMTTLEMYANKDGSIEYNKSVRKALKKAVNFYQEKLTDRIEETTVNENGETVSEVRYELKQNVKSVLSAGELDELNAHVAQMEVWETAYEAQKADAAAASASKEQENETTADEPEVTAVKEAPEEDEAPAVVSNEPGNDTENADGDTGEETTSETEAQTTEASETDGTTETETEAPETESTPETTAQGVAEWISSFLLMAEDIELTSSPEQASYRNALEFYQQYLAATPTIIMDEDGQRTTFGDLMAYQQLNEEVLAYLNPSVLGGETDSTDPVVSEEELEETYERLCIDFCILRLNEEDENFLSELTELYEAFAGLPEAQRERIKNKDRLLGLALLYGLIDTVTYEREEELESESESESEDQDDDDLDDEFDEEDETELEEWDYWDDDYWDDDDDWDDDDLDDEEYTAEELQDMITELEESIKELELDIRECELTVEQSQRIVDDKVVTSSLNGTVISVGDEKGNSDDDYFVRVASSAGLYAKGVISELELSTVNVGDEISGVSDDGESFTAVIKEVSEYPDVNGSDSVYGSGNTNASYYTFYALIDDPDGIEEGYAELTLSDAFTNDGGSIWLENYYVRTDSAGNNYVYVEGSDGKLEQRFVTTGLVNEEWGVVEITGGLHNSDMIAFPYGDNVYEGAPTKEVSSLEALYGD